MNYILVISVVVSALLVLLLIKRRRSTANFYLVGDGDAGTVEETEENDSRCLAELAVLKRTLREKQQEHKKTCPEQILAFRDKIQRIQRKIDNLKNHKHN